MKNAITTIALGGALHIGFTFDGISVIGCDRKIKNKYENLIKILKTTRSDLHFTKDPLFLEIKGYTMPSIKRAHNIMASWIIKEVQKIT